VDVEPVHDASVPAEFRHLYEPIEIGHLTLRNRIVNPVHTTALREARELAYLQTLARGGAALVGVQALQAGAIAYRVGPTSPVAGGDWDQNPLSPLSAEGIAYYDKALVPFLSRRAEIIHAEGALCYAQLGHGGTVRPLGQLMTAPLGPSNVADPFFATVPHALTGEEIGDLVEAFAQDARRVRESGTDAVELHCAHGTLLQAFLSPDYNRRTDRWGGDVARRARFAQQILTRMREVAGDDFPIGVRLGRDAPGSDRGMTVEDLVETAKLLAPLVAFISISDGSHVGFGDGYETAYVSPWYKEPAFAARTSAAVRSAVDLPVLVSGRINDPATAERVLSDGAADLVGLVRPLIADPEFPAKVRDGRAGEVRKCLALNECHTVGRSRVPVTCSVNAAPGRETEMAIAPADIRKVIAVVGAGPAGMEAARVAALRGHHVVLHDAAPTLGGTVRVLAEDANRRNLRDHAEYFESQLPKLDVELRLGRAVAADDLVGSGFDAVIVATGATDRLPVVPGVADANVTTALDVLRGGLPATSRVVVVSGTDNQIAGPAIAEFLADRGHEVEFVSERFDFADGVEDGTRIPLVYRLRKKSIDITPLTRLVGVGGGGADLVDVATGHGRRLDDVTVVLACGRLPNDGLARELAGRVPVQLAGDALSPRRIMHATVEGARAAIAL
jgi:2,4-dienoyl-CoA reductase-like NADH-dependent reductase (Old Yellow Enzyme family)/thioredoxin reductase